MNQITLNRLELNKLVKTIDELYPSGGFVSFVVQQDNSSGIGSITQVSCLVEHKGILGTFITDISTEKDW